jgi:hypothetical protein
LTKTINPASDGGAANLKGASEDITAAVVGLPSGDHTAAKVIRERGWHGSE